MVAKRTVGFFVFIFLAISTWGCHGRSMPAVGGIAPDFSFTLTDGTKHQFAESRGQKTIVIFWSTWCDVCKTELPALNEFVKQVQQSRRDQKIPTQVLGVIVLDQRDRAFEFLKQNPATFKNGVGDSKPISDSYGVSGVPEVFFVDENGVFLPLLDAEGKPVVKLVGGQPWDDPLFIEQFLSPKVTP